MKQKGRPNRSNNFKGRGKRSDAETTRSNKRGRDEQAPSNADNDISWYSRYPNLLVAAGSFPYPYRPGMEMNLGQATVTSAGQARSVPMLMEIPGIMVMKWIPNFGPSSGPTDPPSIMAKEMYARVRAAFSGTLAADAPDYVIYLGALDSVFSYLAWIKRVYRVLNAYTPENYVLPDQVLRAMGLSDAMIAVLRTNKTQLWQMINELVLFSRKFTCPAVMDLMNRHYWMNDNVYTDSNSLNSQFYMFNQWGFYKFAMLNMPDGNPGPGLQMVMNPVATATNTTFTIDTLYNFGRSLIDALVEWDDSYTISGYLRRAYEGAPAFIVEEIPAVTMFTPAYSEEVLAQIENSRTIPNGMTAVNSTNLSNFNVTQDVTTNAIISNPHYVVNNITAGVDSVLGSGAAMIQPLINSRNMSPTVADSVIASRLQAFVDVKLDATAKTATVSISAGTEIPIAWWVLTGIGGTYNYYTISTVVQTTQVGGAAALLGSLKMEAFDWHPIVYVLYSVTDAGNTPQVLPIGDIHNATTISGDNLRNLHKICIYSELNAFNQ